MPAGRSDEGTLWAGNLGVPSVGAPDVRSRGDPDLRRTACAAVERAFVLCATQDEETKGVPDHRPSAHHASCELLKASTSPQKRRGSGRAEWSGAPGHMAHAAHPNVSLLQLVVFHNKASHSTSKGTRTDWRPVCHVLRAGSSRCHRLFWGANGVTVRRGKGVSTYDLTGLSGRRTRISRMRRTSIFCAVSRGRSKAMIKGMEGIDASTRLPQPLGTNKRRNQRVCAVLRAISGI